MSLNSDSSMLLISQSCEKKLEPPGTSINTINKYLGCQAKQNV